MGAADGGPGAERVAPSLSKFFLPIRAVETLITDGSDFGEQSRPEDGAARNRAGIVVPEASTAGLARCNGQAGRKHAKDAIPAGMERLCAL